VPKLPYYYLRALELEGRHPADAGCWPVTIHRLEIGEGLPWFDTDWAYVTFPEGGPFPSTIRPPQGVLWRNFNYRRIRSSSECNNQMLLDPRSRPRPAFYLTAAWANPPGGEIPVPSIMDPPIPYTHSAVLIDRIAERRVFRFQLKWRDWGDHGTGYMPYEYFDQYVVECWASYGHSGVLKLFQLKRIDNEGRVRWSARDEGDHRIYAFEVRGSGKDLRRAWAFVIERDGALELEELYVRPEFRRLGHGRWMADRVAELARKKGMPLRLWVSFADCKSESERNYAALVATSHRLGVKFRRCEMPWAAYFATTEGDGEEFPVEPIVVPGRPRTPRQELLKYVALLGIGQEGTSVNERNMPLVVISPGDAAPVPYVTTSSLSSDDIEMGSPAWESMNQRRGELIDLKIRLGYENMEPLHRAEYDRLQCISQKAIERAFPSPLKDDPDIRRLEELLAAQSGVDEE
jgi:GNAT superfamily N-acetyltransferase